jgi:hypothetical protein
MINRINWNLSFLAVNDNTNLQQLYVKQLTSLKQSLMHQQSSLTNINDNITISVASIYSKVLLFLSSLYSIKAETMQTLFCQHLLHNPMYSYLITSWLLVFFLFFSQSKFSVWVCVCLLCIPVDDFNMEVLIVVSVRSCKRVYMCAWMCSETVNELRRKKNVNFILFSFSFTRFFAREHHWKSNLQ